MLPAIRSSKWWCGEKSASWRRKTGAGLWERGLGQSQAAQHHNPDSTVVRHQHGKPTPSYKNHRLWTTRPAGVVTAVKTTTGAIDEASQLIELIERHGGSPLPRQGWRWPTAVTAIRPTSLLWLSARFKPIVADLRSKLRNARSQGIYPPERFLYQPTGLLQMPGGRNPLSAPLRCSARLLRVSPATGNLRALQPAAVLHAR